jgi:Rrf2 family protein
MYIRVRSRLAFECLRRISEEEGRPCTLKQVRAHLTCSESYIEQIFALLVTAGILKGIRGPGGGYTLLRPLSAITITELVRAVEPQSTVHTELGDALFAMCSCITLAEVPHYAATYTNER